MYVFTYYFTSTADAISYYTETYLALFHGQDHNQVSLNPQRLEIKLGVL